MLLPLLTLALLALAHGAYYEDSFARIHDEVQQKTKLWQPKYNKRFEGMSKDQITQLLGFRRDDKEEHPKKWIINVDQDLPNTFDAREQWKTCSDSIGFIRDQSACGSCWAFASSEVATDRTCIGTDGKETPYISDEDIISCCGTSCGFGCKGGWPLQALKWWTKTGVVTGGPYGSKDDCSPYTISPTALFATTPACKKQCQAGYNTPYAQDKHKGSKYFAIKGGAKAMQQELFDNGPIVACFDVYEDFMSYSSGVYHHTSGQYLGGHAVKVIGWGTESNTDYWLVANSWNATWGDLGGLFKIRRGNDECKFEEDPMAGLA